MGVLIAVNVIQYQRERLSPIANAYVMMDIMMMDRIHNVWVITTSFWIFFIECHFSCLTCKSGNAYSCLTCDSVSNRNTISNGQCLCKDGLFDNGSSSVCQCMILTIISII